MLNEENQFFLSTSQHHATFFADSKPIRGDLWYAYRRKSQRGVCYMTSVGRARLDWLSSHCVVSRRSDIHSFSCQTVLETMRNAKIRDNKNGASLSAMLLPCWQRKIAREWRRIGELICEGYKHVRAPSQAPIAFIQHTQSHAAQHHHRLWYVITV